MSCRVLSTTPHMSERIRLPSSILIPSHSPIALLHMLGMDRKPTVSLLWRQKCDKSCENALKWSSAAPLASSASPSCASATCVDAALGCSCCAWRACCSSRTSRCAK